jgi:hypothetical protein
MTLMKLGIVLDAIGFLLVFCFGGLSFGVANLVVGPASWWVLPCKVVGAVCVIAGFVAMYLGQA